MHSAQRVLNPGPVVCVSITLSARQQLLLTIVIVLLVLIRKGDISISIYIYLYLCISIYLYCHPYLPRHARVLIWFLQVAVNVLSRMVTASPCAAVDTGYVCVVTCHAVVIRRLQRKAMDDGGSDNDLYVVKSTNSEELFKS